MNAIQLAILLAMYAHDPSAGPDIPVPQSLPPVQQRGVATWYGNGAWHGSVTANGEPFDPQRFTCAHRDLPFDTMVLIVNRATHRRVWCRVNDRGPFGATLSDGSWGVKLNTTMDGEWRGVLDMSIATATALGTIQSGKANVELRYWKRNSQERFHLAAIDR